MPVDVAANTEQQVRVVVSPKTPSGKPAQVEGPVTVEVSSGSAVVSEQPSAEKPNEFVFVSDSPGDGQIVVKADADLDVGEVREISDVINYSFAGVEAESLGVTATVEPRA